MRCCVMHCLAGLALTLSFPAGGLAADIDEFRVKREEVFEFAEKPTVTRASTSQPDRFVIGFAAKGYCDATVAIEDRDGRIVRHLASGVLGPNAPAPFEKGALRQAVVWDGKNDQGEYVRDPERCTVRVSLGLKPLFDRILYWSPKKRVTSKAIIVPVPEGVYVFEGSGVDHLRLFSHAGEYVRTIYPFPPDRIKDVRGLTWKEFPGGGEFPIKPSYYQQTFLTSGQSGCVGSPVSSAGSAATAMALHKDRLALVSIRLNRLATDGSTGGLAMEGPITSFQLTKIAPGADAYDAPKDGVSADSAHIAPRSAAFSPDGKWLYLTGYTWKSTSYGSVREWLHGVWKVAFDGAGELTLFAGSGKRGRDLKPDDARLLKVPAAVVCDAAGRVYVADHENDRVQVFSPEGTVVKTIPVVRPAALAIHHKTKELYVFSWQLASLFLTRDKEGYYQAVKPTWTRFGPFDDPRVLQAGDLPLIGAYKPYNVWGGGLEFAVALDSWSDGGQPDGPPAIWAVTYAHDQGVSLQEWTTGFSADMFRKQARWEKSGIQLYDIEKDGALKLRRDFGQEVVRDVARASWPSMQEVQRLYVNPATGLLYVGEGDTGTLGKSFHGLVEIDPASGRIRIIDLPFAAEDMAFGANGFAYLRQTDVIVRYEFGTWREVPWDYGEELDKVGMWGGRFAKATSALVIPSRSPVCFHQGGLFVSPNGNLVVSCAYRVTDRKRDIDRWETAKQVFVSKPYVPPRYPGREESPLSACAHVWDSHGKVIFQDAIPGMPCVDGIAIDRDNDLYIMATPARVVDGEPYFDRFSSTLVKFQPGRGKIITSAASCPVPLPEDEQPKRAADLYNAGGKYWVEGAQWFFGGVGYSAFNTWAPACSCWHARFTLDYFGRSFAPAPLRFSVAVVDKAGNLILRVGRYGNEDSAGPASRSPVGGDEVGLMHPAFVAVHTDNRLFVADYGNARIVSVKLDYHATERATLKGAN